MNKLKILTIALFGLLSFSAFAQMSDKQVIEYVKAGSAAGKSEEQIGKELLARGVTQVQVDRLKSKYSKVTEETSVTEQALDGTGAIGRESSSFNSDSQDLANVVNENVEARDQGGKTIYGHNIFNSRNLSFEPNVNAATPENYKLGPGDELIIDIWGYNEAQISKTISPEGIINISQIGPVQLNGLTIKEAQNKIKKLLVQKYASIGGEKPNSSVSITLGKIRTILVNVMGEVRTPGTYRLSSFSTVFNALYNAGGVTNSGSMRAIKVIRGGEVVATVDVYEYLLEGKTKTDIALREDDIIQVPTYIGLVGVSGSVKRPMYYEIDGKETLQDVIDYAGGFTSNAYKDDMRVIRNTGAEREIFTVKSGEYKSFKMEDGDEISVGETLDRYSNMVEIRGSVFRPGMYQLGEDIATVKQLVKQAGGLKEDAFTSRAVITREKDNLDLETVSINLGAIMDGTISDVLLRKNDILVISSNHELEDRGTLTINGQVTSPGVFPYSDNTTVEDLILQAGGLLSGASTARVDVARRIVDSERTTPSDTLSETYTFAIKDGLAVDGGENFILQPYDVVSIRRSPGFSTQKFVSITGEVAFPGRYVLLNEDERISDVIKRAGGTTKSAYVSGAMLVRRLSDGERTVRSSIKNLVREGSASDSLNMAMLNVTDHYSVALDLKKAMENPGSKYDITLKADDDLLIPEITQTVHIQGEVMYPNAVLYVKGKGLRYYINAAGGFTSNAKKTKAYIVYVNGEASRGSIESSRIEPGCTIIIPSKIDRKGMSPQEAVSMASAATSLASIITILYRIFLIK